MDLLTPLGSCEIKYAHCRASDLLKPKSKTAQSISRHLQSMGLTADLHCSVIVYSYSITDKWEGQITAISAQIEKHLWGLLVNYTSLLQCKLIKKL